MGLSTAEVCRKQGVSTATFHKWKARFGGITVRDTFNRLLRLAYHAKVKLCAVSSSGSIDRGARLFEKTRAFERDDEASAYASQLLRDWPDCAAIDVLHAGALVDRLKPSVASRV